MNPITITTNYIKTSVAELKKVTWPTKDQTIRYSVLVVIVSVVIAAFFAGLDFAFSRGVLYAVSHTPSGSPAEQTPVTPNLEQTSSTERTDTPSNTSSSSPVLPSDKDITLPKQ